MAAPNIANVTTITGKTSTTTLSNTSSTVIVSNAASSGKVFKINTIIVANIDGSSTANITVNVHPQDDGAGTGVPIASTIDVVADSTLVVLDKSSSIYLEEDTSIAATASVGGDLSVTCSYEEITDD